MQFMWSPVLWALVLVPLLLGIYVWLQTRRRKFAARYSSLALVRPALDQRHRWRRHIPPALFLGALALMLVGLARPVAVVRAPRQEGIVILAMDSSGSMRADDVHPNRFEAAMAAADKFIDTRPPGAAVGIVAFAGSAVTVQMPTDDKEDLHAALRRLRLQRSTAIGSGILESLDTIALAGQPELPATNSASPLPIPTLPPVLPGTYIPAIIILLTDGQNRSGPDPLDAAKVAAERGVRVYTIGMGTTEGVTLRGSFGGGSGGGGFRAELDEETLRAVAAETGGEYFYAKDATDLERIYGNLGLNIVLKADKYELTAWFTLAAAALLLGAIGLSIVWSTLT